MQAYIPTKADLEEIVSRTVKDTVKEVLPEAIRKGTRKKWLTTDEVMEMLSCSRPHIQYLRDNNQIDFSQSGRTIRYHVDDVEDYLNNHKVKSVEK